MSNDLYPGYDVLSKRDTPSWNEQTRRVLDRRLAVPDQPRFFNPSEWQTLRALCGRIMPQPEGRPPVPLAAHVDEKIHVGREEGYRPANMPRQGLAWQRGLAALDAEAAAAYLDKRFHELAATDQDALLHRAQDGALSDPAWGDMPCALFFTGRVIHDILNAYYAHPTAWNEIGWAGPAGPRGYVRMGFNRRDPWEASEARPGREAKALRENKRVG